MILLLASGAFILLGWRALEAAGIEMAAGSDRILTQFVVVGVLGHLGLRFVAPFAASQPYAIALFLTAIGLVFVSRLAPALAQDQANWVTLGVVLMLVTAGLSSRYRVLRRYKYTAALAGVGLLLLTGIFGTTINGARLWIVIFGQSVQTTELIKVFLLLFLAGYLADEADVLSAPRIRFAGRTYSTLPYLIPLALTLLLAVMALALLRDLGSIALLLLLAMAMLYVATGKVRFVVAGILLLGLTAIAGYAIFDHVQARVDTWLDPYADAAGAGYQSLQSLYAIQAGGVTGEGLGLGQPTVIPAATTDYVFSAIGEELGLVGALGVIMLYISLLFAGLRVALSVRDDYGRLVASCTALLITIQMAVIIAGNLRLIPTTGITLPFVSYGGSSLIVNFVLIGLLLGISNDAQRRSQE
ncbi:MAG TPA: FtsW/RodA/SpoVE family cell cycle protein [Tepidiformaceae bacterium]